MENIKTKLSSASCILLGISTSAIADNEPWIIDLGVMNFIEQDRNTGIEFIAKGTRDLDDGGTLSLSSELDVITGATPNGATSSNVPQTFTMSSGIGSYSASSNEQPVDDTHMDTRMAVKAALVDPVSDSLTADYNAMISMEFDYLSFAGGGNLALDLNRNNTTLTAGINLEYNRVHPVGNTPVPFATMQPAGQPQIRDVSAKSKSGEEFSVGLNQIINRTSLFQARLTTSHFSGYLTDPYKIISIVENQNQASLGSTLSYVYENRPDSRTMKSLYLAYKKSYDSGVLDLGYRIYEDSWDIQSHTFDVAYKFKMDDHFFLRPSVRFYQQNEAFFYRHSLLNDETIPTYASAESRLADFDASTIGLEIGKDLAFDRKQSFTIEYYIQQGDSHPSDAVGLQQQQDLYPSLKTLIFKYVYSLKW